MQLNNLKNKFSSFWNKRKGSGNSREFIGKLSRGLMLPISLLPVAGLFLGIGAAIVNGSNGNEGLELFGKFLQLPGDAIFGALPVLFAIAIAITFTRDAGTAGLSALVAFLAFGGIQQALIQPVINAAGQTIGYDLLFYAGGMWSLAGDPKFGLDTSLFGSVLGWIQLSTSVFGGFIVGFTVAFLYNKFKDIQLPPIIGFFSGVRFIPLVTFMAFIPITLLVLMVWPLVGTLFGLIGGALGSGMYGFQSFIFGYIERSLVPFGLHHAFYSPLWYSSIGGELNLNDLAIVNGQFVSLVANGTSSATWLDIVKHFDINYDINSTSIAGDQVMWAFVNSNLAGKKVFQLGTSAPLIVQFSDLTTTVYQEALLKLNGLSNALSKGVNIGQYMQGKYPFMMFGLPAAGVAMVMAAPKENRRMAGSVVISASLTCFLTGITEPLEFTFLFLAPWLFWGFHAFFCALSFGLMNWIGLIVPDIAPHVGMTFSGGIIDWTIYGAIQIPAGSNAWVALLIGIPYIPIYFFFFLWAIKKFNIMTPGRGDNTKLYSKADYLASKDTDKSQDGYDGEVIGIIKAYGGLENIVTVDACITKLRIKVVDPKKVDEKKLTNELGAMGVIRPSQKAVYSIYGTRADWIKNQINSIITDVEKNPKLKDEIFSKDFEKNIKKIDSNKVNSNSNMKNETLNVYSPFDGEIVSLKKVPDKTFSDEIMGKGLAIIPSSKKVSSILEKGELDLIFDTGHAYIFKSEEGTSLLLHIGIDSINLKDSSKKDVPIFKINSKKGDKLKKDLDISEINLNNLEKYAKSPITPIIALNETLEGRNVEIIAKKGKVKKGDLLFVIKP